MTISEDQHSGRVQFSYLPHRDAYLVSASTHTGLFIEVLTAAVSPHLRCQPQRRSPAWHIEPRAATSLAGDLQAAGFRVTGPGSRQHCHEWARSLFQRAGKRHRDTVFTSLLRVLDIGGMRELADVYDKAAR